MMQKQQRCYKTHITDSALLVSHLEDDQHDGVGAAFGEMLQVWKMCLS